MSNAREEKTTKPHRLLAFSAAIALAMGAACSDDEPSRPAPPVPEPTPLPPGAVLNQLVYAYVNQDIDTYESILAPEFRFVPSPTDTGVPEFDLVGDVTSTRQMFERAESIYLRLAFGKAVPSDRTDYPADEGYMSILVSDVDLRVETGQLIDRETLVVAVAGDSATFIFKPDSPEEPLRYTIVYQQDHGS